MISWMLALVPGAIAARPKPKPDVKAERDALKDALDRARAEIAGLQGLVSELRGSIRDLEGTVTELRQRERAMLEWQMRRAMPLPNPLALQQAPAQMAEMQARVMTIVCNCTPARGDVLRRQFQSQKKSAA